MPTPTNRTPLRVARGTYSNLNGSLSDLQEGEITFATDEGRLYVKQGGSLTSISASSQAAPGPANVTASPAFVGGNGTQGNPYQITSLGSAFSGAEAQSAQEITISATPGDFVIFTDNSVNASGNRFANQVVGNVDSGGSFVFKLKYKDAPGTTVNNTTYNGRIQIGSVYFSWVVVQSNMTLLSEVSATSFAIDSLGVGGTATATEGTVTGGTSGYTYATRWQRSFNGTNGWFDTGNTGTTYTIQSADSGYYIRAVTTGTDSTPSNQGGPLTLDIVSGSSSQINTAGAANVGSFVLTEDNTTGARYTSKTFSAVANLNPDGVPVSTKALKVKFDGSFSTFPDTSDITGISTTDDIGTNINATNLSYTPNGGGSQSGGTYNWTQHYVTSAAGHAFVTFATSYPAGTNMQMYKSTYGLDANTTPGDSASINSSNSPSASLGKRYRDSTMTNTWEFYQTSSGSNSTSGIYFSEVYKDDTLLHNHQQGNWLYLENSLSVSNGIWKPINASTTAQGATQGQRMMGLTDDRQYAVNCSQSNTTSAKIHIMDGDICDHSGTVTTTDLDITWSEWAPSGAGTSSIEIQGFFGHGSKISMSVRFYNNSSYSHYLFTCDFSAYDGSQKSHWVVTLGPVNTSTDFYLSRVAVDGNKVVVAYGNSGNYAYISTNNGGSYSSFNVSPAGWSIQGIECFSYSRGRLLAFCKGVNSSIHSQDSSQPRWFIAMSSNNGGNWTPSIRNSTQLSRWAQYIQMSNELVNRQGIRNMKSGGGLTIINAQYYLYYTTYYYYRQLFWFDDYDTVSFTDSTNLGNNSFRNGDKVRQGQATAHISAISGSTARFLSINGTFATGSPVSNTVNYFGGSLSTMYGVINTAGLVTDLTTTEPSFVNLGYLTDNTITFPATLPSGNSPDVELASGTSITVSAEFANSQGTVSATSNTVTPS